MKTFHTILRTNKWDYQKINDVSNIVDYYNEKMDFENLMNRIDYCVSVEKEKYGFVIYWIDNLQYKSTHVRDDGKYVNTTIKSKQSVKDFVKMFFISKKV